MVTFDENHFFFWFTVTLSAGHPVLEKVYEDGDDIFEEDSNEEKDILEEVFDDGDDIFESILMVLKTYLRKFLSMKGVSRVFQGCFKGVSRVFNVSFIGV